MYKIISQVCKRHNNLKLINNQKGVWIKFQASFFIGWCSKKILQSFINSSVILLRWSGDQMLVRISSGELSEQAHQLNWIGRNNLNRSNSLIFSNNGFIFLPKHCLIKQQINYLYSSLKKQASEIKQLLKKFLIIQTAFIGDVVLATPIIEKLHQYFPEAQIDFLLRKGNEKLLDQHPILNEVIVWNKKEGKYSALKKIIQKVRAAKYDYVINAQRFFSTGLITALSGATTKIGFDKNPLSLFYSKKVKHVIGEGHEVQRNINLIAEFTDDKMGRPKLYPSEEDARKVKTEGPYVCIAPTSVWFTKQFPGEKWAELLQQLPQTTKVFLLGGPADAEACAEIMRKSGHPLAQNYAGKLSFLESVALMKNAVMNYVNDSAPLHFASSVNAPVTAIFCSTIPDFGFTPLSDNSTVIQSKEALSCRPCGLHGFKACPKGHFNCAKIETARLLPAENS